MKRIEGDSGQKTTAGTMSLKEEEFRARYPILYAMQ